MDIEEAAFRFLPKVKRVLDEIPLKEQIPYAYKEIENLFHIAKMKEEIQCGRQDCSFCCHDSIMLSKQEAEYIKDNASYEIDQDLLLKQRSARDFKKLSFADRACVFLKEGKCQVYDFRPLICRTHNVRKGTKIENCIVTNGSTKEPNQQAYSIPAQALSYYFIMKDFPTVKSTYEYDFKTS